MAKRKDYMKDLWSKTLKELVKARKKFRDELFALRMKNSVKGLKQTHQIKDVRKKIARINTVLTSKIKVSYGNSVK